MNTYGSAKSLDSQILGKKIQEQSIAVSQNVPQQSPRLLEQNLDQIQIQQKKKVVQGMQGKSKSQLSTAKKPFHVDEKKIKIDKNKLQTKKRLVIPISKTISPGKKMVSKKQCSVHDNHKEIKEKQNLLQIHKKEEQKGQQIEKKQIQQYIHLKKTQSTINLQIQKLQQLIEQKRKLENLVQLDQTIKNGFYQQKNVEIMKKKSKKKKSKKKINKDDNKIQSTKQIQVFNASKSQNGWHQQKREKSPMVNHKKLEQIFKQRELKILKMFPPTNNLLQRIVKSIKHNGLLNLDQLTEQDLLLIQLNQLNLAAVQIQSIWRGFKCRREISQQKKYQNLDEEFDLQTLLSSKFNNDEQQDMKIKKMQNENKDNVKAKKQISLALQKMKIAFTKQCCKPQLSPQKESDKKQIEQQVNNNEEEHQSYESTPVKKSKSDHKVQDQNLVTPNKQDLQIIQEIQSELDHWDINIDSLLQKSQKDMTVNTLKQQMKNTIVTIVQQQIQKYKDSKSNQRNDTDNSQDNNLRLSQEIVVEKNFNEIRKKFKTVQEQSEEKILQQSKEAFLDVEILQKQDKSFRESSLLAIQSQLMKKESELLTMRQEAIQLRYNAEVKKCQNEPEKKKELDTWLDKELEDLQLTRQAIEISIKREASAMKKIQRDLLIAQSFDENNSKLQNLKSKVDEQLSNLKQSRQNSLDIKLVNNFCINQENEIEKLAETQSEDFEQEDIEQRGLLKENVIESYEEMEQRAKINLVTSDIIGDIIDELADEILVERNQYDLLIQMLIRSSIPPCIPTAIIDIRYYIHNLFEFILQLHLNEILRNLNTSYGFCALNRLQFIHGYDEHENKIKFVTFTLNEEFFFQFEKYRLSQVETEYEDSTSEVMKELEHIHNKAIFDACNEALNQARPYYYTNGVPYPWEQRNPCHIIHEENLSETLRNMEQKIVQWANSLCGFHPVDEDIPISRERQVILDEKNQQLMMQQMQQYENPDLYDPQLIPYYDPILQIQEKQLYHMLIQDIKENEYRWHQSSDDRTELLMEVGDWVFEQMIEEFLKEQQLQL